MKPYVFCLMAWVGVAMADVTWSFGPSVYGLHYKEPGVMQDNGMMVGLYGRYTHIGRYLFEGEGHYVTGSVQYDGSGALTNHDYIFELRGIIGKRMPKHRTLVPYLGIGYRYLLDQGAGRVSSTGKLGYDREQAYVYTPLGMQWVPKGDGPGWHVQAHVEWDVLWVGINHTHLGAIPGYQDLKLHQSHGVGYRFGLRMKRRMAHWVWSFEPFYRHWHVQSSDLVIDGNQQVWHEPDNHINEFGLTCSLSH